MSLIPWPKPAIPAEGPRFGRLRRLIRLRPVLLGLCLAACTQLPPLAVEPIHVTAKDQAQRIPGRYVAFVGTAPSSLSGRLWGCPFYTTPAALLAVYTPALQSALINNFDQVDFLSTPIAAGDVAARGYRAAFVFNVMNSLNPPAQPGTVPDLVYTGSVELIDAAGAHVPVPVSGRAQLPAARTNCQEAQQIIATATHNAITDLIQQDLNAARNAIRPPPPPPVTRPAF